MKKNIIIIVIIVIIAGISLYPTFKNTSIDIDKLLQNAQQENKFVMLELSSPTCSICRRMQPFLKQLEEEYPNKLIIKTIDIVARTDIARKFQATAVPTQVFIDNKGSVYYKHVGYLSKSEILQILSKKGF